MMVRKLMVLVLAIVLMGSLAYGGQIQDTSGKYSVRAITPRIVGGEKVTSLSEYPWVVALCNFIKDGQNESFEQFCGGSIIGDKWILTAAHCIESSSGGTIDTENFYVLTGTLSLEDFEREQLLKVRRIIKHPDYDSELITSDIALLELEEPLTAYEAIPLYRSGSLGMLAGEMSTVIGWGNTVGYGHPDEVKDPWMLREVELPIISNEDCEAAFTAKDEPTSIDKTMLCAGLDEGCKDSCQGDSGGPLVILESGVWKQAGLVSWGGGLQCAEEGFYGVYTRVSKFTDFIDGYVQGLSVWGRITTSAAGHDDLGVKNAKVSFVVGETDYDTVTDVKGDFSITIPQGKIPVGDYRISVTGSGIVPLSHTFTVKGKAGESIGVSKKGSLMLGDFSGDNKLGVEDCIGILQVLTGERN